jgi:hypothetical protein
LRVYPEKRQMADKDDASSEISGRREEAARIHSTEGDRGPERAEGILAQLVDAACSAAESLAEEQKRRLGQRVSGIAEALRSAVHPLDRSENRIVSRYVEQAANEAENFARKIREHRWNELLAETEDLARRQPTLFVLGAVATGFLIGRLVGAPANRPQLRADVVGSSGQAAESVVAAVSSGSRTAAGEPRVESTQPPGAAEMR